MGSTVAKSIRLEQEIDQRLERLAASKDRAPHYLMREAIAEYVEREERRQAFIESGRAAWDEYQRTGEHVTLTQFAGVVKKLKARKGGKTAAR